MVEINEGVRRPKAFAKILTGDNFPRRFQEGRKEQKRLFLQPDLTAILSQLAGAEVYFEIRKPYHWAKGRWHGTASHYSMPLRSVAILTLCCRQMLYQGINRGSMEKCAGIRLWCFYPRQCIPYVVRPARKGLRQLGCHTSRWRASARH